MLIFMKDTNTYLTYLHYTTPFGIGDHNPQPNSARDTRTAVPFCVSVSATGRSPEQLLHAGSSYELSSDEEFHPLQAGDGS